MIQVVFGIYFYKFSDVLKAIVSSRAFLEKRPLQLANLNDVINYKNKLEEKIAVIEKDERAEDIHLMVTDIYYLFLLRKLNKQIECCDTIIGIYSYIYSIDFAKLDEIDRRQILQPMNTSTRAYTAEQILHKPINLELFECNLLTAIKYTTYLFNKENEGMNLTEYEFFDVQECALEEMKNKNRRK